jgi:hypothetical protein
MEWNMKQRLVALVLSLAVASAGCASTRYPNVAVTASPLDPSTSDPVMASYVRQLPVGSRVRVTLADGHVIHGTLMKSDGDPLVVQRRTRIPEAPLQIRIGSVRAVELEKQNGGPGRAIAIGAATGAGAALGVLLVLAAVFSD